VESTALGGVQRCPPAQPRGSEITGVMSRIAEGRRRFRKGAPLRIQPPGCVYSVECSHRIASDGRVEPSKGERGERAQKKA